MPEEKTYGDAGRSLVGGHGQDTEFRTLMNYIDIRVYGNMVVG